MAVPFWHKLVFIVLIFLMLSGSWRALNRLPSVQKVLHKLPAPVILQWYTICFFAFGAFLLECLGNIVLFDYRAANWLDPEQIEDLWDKNNISQDLRDDYALPGWLRWISLVSPMVGTVAFVILLIHAALNVRSGARWRKEYGSEEEKELNWKSSTRQELVLLVITMPAVFIIMSVRSTERMWMVMRGFHTGAEAVTDLALFEENLELAAVCQYYTVFVFSQICVSLLEEQKGSKDMKTAIKFVGFQGVYAWCLVGSIHSIILFVIAFFGHHIDQSDPDQVAVLAKGRAAEKTVGTIASVLSLLCTYNMLVVCKLPYMKKALGNASMKFNGTKILLLLGPNQLKILMSLTTDAAVMGPKKQLANFLDLSTERAMLLHSSLLSIECLAVVILNLVSWRGSADAEKIHMYGDVYTKLEDE
jgi:hypothetical protein